MLFYLTIFMLSTFMIFGGKAIADIVSDSSHWYQSIFNHNKIDGFWGAKDKTWVRKYQYGKWNFLFTTILVWITDVWHFANLINRLGTYLAVFCAIEIGHTYCKVLTFDIIIFIVCLFAIINVVGFHILYTYVLRRKYDLYK